MEKQFSFTDEEFIAVVNVILKRETASNVEFKPVTSIEDTINADMLDSLDMLIFFVWLADIFEIADDKIGVFVTTGEFTILALKEFVMANQTQTYSYKEALEFEYT